MNEKEKNRMRRLLEMAYLFAWGPDGTADRRDEWWELKALLPNVGTMCYGGNGKFRWDE